ncbi:MAG: glycine--tRNA ligase subunit beta [Steroidobacteraceae bacterium]
MTADARDFLVEIGTEELPPKALHSLEQAFASGIGAGLSKATLKHGAVQSFATPRRLAVLVRQLAVRQSEQRIERRGPPVTAAFDAAGQPTRAAQAFAASCGVDVHCLERRSAERGEFLYYRGVKAGAAAIELLPAIVQEALDALPIPRRMRWGAGEAQFVRPVHWVVMLYGREVIAAKVLETAAGNLTRGHRFHTVKPLRIASPGTYERMLATRGFVVADFQKRRARVSEQVNAAAGPLGGRAVIGAALLDEVTALLEWPVALAGRFEERFLQLPREVLISTLEDHQRYFPVESPDGTLLPCFIAVANIESREPHQVIAGNERVIRPRLADAAFFWDQDRKTPLSARIEALDTVTFEARLGSLGDRARRIRALAVRIATSLGRSPAPLERAALLCKCDLLTAMVGEFPELQGVMGSYYAAADGEDREVATALREHYLPRASGDALPLTGVGTLLAVADKLDTLASIFTIGIKPTGTKDPFGLRRAAIGLTRILLEQRLDLDLTALVEQAIRLARADVERIAVTAGKPAPVMPNASTEVYDYIFERLRTQYLEGELSASRSDARPVTTEMFDAVLATRPASPLDFDARLRALSRFLALPEAVSLTAANKRVVNILKRSTEAADATLDAALLTLPAERHLYEALRSLRATVTAALAEHDYAGALAQLAGLRAPVDTFFDQVMVMDEDPARRANRLALLREMRELFAGVADLTRLPG